MDNDKMEFKGSGVFPPAIYENGAWKEAPVDMGHRADGQPWEGVQRNTSFPQPAPALPHHHTPTKPPVGTRYPNPVSSSGGASFTALLYEDEGIRVFENRIQPGLLGPKHRHDDDYWLVNAHAKHRQTPGSISMTIQQSNNDPAKQWQLANAGKPTEGSVAFVKNGHTETADNPPENPVCIFYAIEIMKPEGQVPVAIPAGWGASAGVLFENTEVKISDLRVPAGQEGEVPLLSEGTKKIFHVDVTGQRDGAASLAELRAGPGMGFGRKKHGDTYAFMPGQKRAHAKNVGEGPYRGVVVEVKDVEPLITARL